MKKQQILEQELIERTENSAAELADRINDLAVPTTPLPATEADASIVNLMDDTDFNWSQAAYTTAGVLPATAGDTNNRAYGWYRIERATALPVEDDAHSLKGPAHSLAAAESADTPQWNKTEGWAEMGETGATPWDLYAPFPTNVVTPGMRLRIQMLVRLRTSASVPPGLKFFWELYDGTNATPGIIKGSALALNGSTFGAAGATTRSYKLIVDTDYGNQVESTVRTITNTPAVLTPTNGVVLSWERIPGFTRVTIYVTEGGASFIAGIIGNGTNSFNDTGQLRAAVASVPSVTTTAAVAYAETSQFVPTLDWILWKFTIITPQTYNFSATTGKQYLRGGLIGLMGAGRQLLIDRIGVSPGN